MGSYVGTCALGTHLHLHMLLHQLEIRCSSNPITSQLIDISLKPVLIVDCSFNLKIVLNNLLPLLKMKKICFKSLRFRPEELSGISTFFS